jgi:hypothetical protein
MDFSRKKCSALHELLWAATTASSLCTNWRGGGITCSDFLTRAADLSNEECLPKGGHINQSSHINLDLGDDLQEPKDQSNSSLSHSQ